MKLHLIILGALALAVAGCKGQSFTTTPPGVVGNPFTWTTTPPGRVGTVIVDTNILVVSGAGSAWANGYYFYDPALRYATNDQGGQIRSTITVTMGSGGMTSVSRWWITDTNGVLYKQTDAPTLPPITAPYTIAMSGSLPCPTVSFLTYTNFGPFGPGRVPRNFSFVTNGPGIFDATPIYAWKDTGTNNGANNGRVIEFTFTGVEPFQWMTLKSTDGGFTYLPNTVAFPGSRTILATGAGLYKVTRADSNDAPYGLPSSPIQF